VCRDCVYRSGGCRSSSVSIVDTWDSNISSVAFGLSPISWRQKISWVFAAPLCSGKSQQNTTIRDSTNQRDAITPSICSWTGLMSNQMSPASPLGPPAIPAELPSCLRTWLKPRKLYGTPTWRVTRSASKLRRASSANKRSSSLWFCSGDSLPKRGWRSRCSARLHKLMSPFLIFCEAGTRLDNSCLTGCRRTTMFTPLYALSVATDNPMSGDDSLCANCDLTASYSCEFPSFISMYSVVFQIKCRNFSYLLMRSISSTSKLRQWRFWRTEICAAKIRKL